MAQYDADQRAVRRLYSAPLDPARWERADRFLADWLARVDAVDFEALDPASRVDWLLLRGELLHQQRALPQQRGREEEVAPLLPFAPPLVELCTIRARREPVDAAAAAGVLASAVKAVADARKGFESEKPVVTAALAGRAAERAEGLRGALEDWYEFSAEYDPQFTWWVRQPWEQLAKSLAEYARFLRETIGGLKPDDADQLVGDPIGREALLEALAHERIPYTPEELVQIAEREHEWCLVELRKAAADMGLGQDWHEALERVKGDFVAPGEQPQLIRRLAEEATRYVTEHDLVTVPPLCAEAWRMQMMSAERQKLNPYFTGGEVISISFPTAGMEHEDKLMSLRGNNVHFCRATVHHELIPGHHLQGFQADRWRPWRQTFGTAFLVEGWALYWEMLLWDRGFFQSPEDRVGALFWRNHRTARIVFSLNFHLGNWTPQQCVDYLVDEVGHERRGAEAEVRRSIQGGYGPLYQCAYMLGGLQLRSLRGELVEGGGMGEREFHDAVLRENAIPVELIRAALSGLPLERELPVAWRFYPL
ncbi:MAG: DUF885 family protein [Planctomycetota bacterium]|nr:MAG: DUF885 family protein [Planctomycetota bacterium]